MSKDLANLLKEANQRNGFPAGTMESIVKQETGGNKKYINDPSAYHYAANADGKRIAGHTGKISTAFGPFGIVESTGRKPGYGVAPLKNKSIEEQVRFASEYLAGRAKQAGSLQAGLAGYGEGAKYAKAVVDRIPGGKQIAVAQAKPSVLAMPDAQVLAMAQAPAPQRVQVPVPQPVQEPIAAAPMMAQAQDVAPQIMAAAPEVAEQPWAAFGNSLASMANREVTPESLDFGSQQTMSPLSRQVAMQEGFGSDDNNENVQNILQKFGLGRYASGFDERYQAMLPDFSRTSDGSLLG